MFNVVVRGLICALIASFIGYLTYGNLKSFDSESFIKVMGVLLNVSAIVFAIIGAWIAIIYPNIIRSAISGDREEDYKNIKEAVKDADYLSELFEIVLQSAIVICAAVSVQVVLPIFQAYTYFGLSGSQVRLAGVVFMVFFSLLQVNAILTVVAKNFAMLSRVRKMSESDTLDHDS